MKNTVRLAILLLVFTQGLHSQTSWKGTISTNWKTAGNWTAGVPTSLLDATIGDASFTGAFQPTLTATAACKSLTLGTGAIVSKLTVAKNLTVSGNITIGANGYLINTLSNRVITLKGNWTNSGSYTSSGTSTVTFSGTAQSLTGATTFQQVIVNAGSTVTLANSIVVSTNVFINGTLNPTAAFTVSGTGALTVNSGGTILVLASDFTSNYTLTGGITLNGASTVNYASAAINQNVSNVYTYGYLRISGGMTKTLIGNLPALNSTSAAAGKIYLDAGTFNLLGFTANRGTAVAGGAFSVAALAYLKIGGLNTFPSNYTTKTFAALSTVEYNGTNQLIAANSYGNLTFTSSSGLATKTMPGVSMMLGGNLTSNAGLGTGVSFTAANNLSVSKDVILDASSVFDGGSYSHIFRGNWSNDGTFTGSTSTVNFNGVNALLSGTGSNNFYNVTFSRIGISAAGNTPIGVSGNLLTSGPGTFTHAAGGTTTLSGAGKTIVGNGFILANCIITGSITTGANFVVNENFTGNGTFAANAGTLTLTGASKVLSGSGTNTFYSLNITGTLSTAIGFSILGNVSVTGSASFTSTAGTITFNGTSCALAGVANLFHVTIAATKTLRLGSNSILGIAGVFTKTGTLNVTTTVPNTVQYNASGAQNVVSTTYSNLIIQGAGIKTAQGAINVNNDFTLSTGATFDASSYILSLYRNWLNNGTFTASTSDVQFRGAGAATIAGVTTFNSLTVNKSSTMIWVSQLNNVTAATLTTTQGNLSTGANNVTITGTRFGTGTGVIVGTIIQNHAFLGATPYYFEGPNNILTFTSPSAGLTSVTVTVTLGEIADFDPTRECVLREYDISIPAGTYTNATLRLHYQDNELNAFDKAFLTEYKFNSGTTWDSIGWTSRNSVSDYVEKTGIMAGLVGRWTLSGVRNLVRWNGSVSSAWETPANWTTISGSNMSNRIPTSTDGAEIGQAAFTNNPSLTSAQTVNVLRYGSAQGSTTTINGGSLTTVGSIKGLWTGAASHVLDVSSNTLSSGTNITLSDGTIGHDIQLKIGTGTANVNGDLTQSASGSVVFTGNGTLSLNGHYTYSGGTFTGATGTVIYTGNAVQNVAPVTYNNLLFTKTSDRASISANTTVNGNLTLTTGGEVYVSDTLSVLGNINIGVGTILLETGTLINVGGNWVDNGLFTVSNSTVNFNGSGNQTLSAETFHTLQVNKPSGIVTLTGNILETADLTIAAGTLDLSGFSADRSNPGGSLTVAGTAVLNIGGGNYPANFILNTLGNSSTVEYNGSAAQNIMNITYGNLTLTNGGVNTKTLLDNIQVNGDLLINSGATLDPSSFSIKLFGNMTTNGTFSPSSSTLILEGVSKTIQGSSVLSVNNITASGGSYSVSNAVTTIAGNLFVDIAPSSLNFGSGTVSLDGDLTNKGSLTSSGTLNITGTRLQTLSLIGAITSSSTGIVNFNGTVLPVTFSTSSPSFYTVNINNTGGTLITSQPWTVVKAMNIASGAAVDFGALTHVFYGDFNNSGTVLSSGKLQFTPILAGAPFPASATISLDASGGSFTSTGTIEFAGSGAITLATTNPTITNLSVINTNAAGLTAPVGMNVGQDFFIGPGALFDAGLGLIHTITGNMTNNGTLTGSSSNMTFNGAPVSLNGLGSSTFSTLTIGTGADVTLNQPIAVTADLVNNGTFTATGRSVTFSGTTATTISGTTGSITLDDVIQNKTGALTTTLAIPVTVTGDLAMTNGVINTTAVNILTLNDSATASAGSGTCFVDGPMLKIGSEAFVFPVGNGNKWARIGISAPATAATSFQAQYHQAAYSNVASVLAPLDHVSVKEHWILNRTAGTDNVTATLFWEDGLWSGITDLSADSIVVARFNGTNWTNETQNGGTTGSTNSGTITSQTVTSFSPFTFGAKSAVQNPLPIELLSFAATKAEQVVDLKWIVSSEVNNDYFTVERTKNGTEYEEVSRVKGAGNTSQMRQYTVVDQNPLEGLTYYRLKQTDFDGKFTYSPVVSVDMNAQMNIRLFPNPARSGDMPMIKISGFKEGAEINLTIYDINGREVYKRMLLSSSSNQSLWELNNNLPAGIYQVTLSDGLTLFKQKLLIY